MDFHNTWLFNPFIKELRRQILSRSIVVVLKMASVWLSCLIADGEFFLYFFTHNTVPSTNMTFNFSTMEFAKIKPYMR